MSNSETHRKASWLRSKGRAYSDRRNEVAKEYQKTFFGRLAVRSGNANTLAKMRGVCGRITAGDLLNVWASQNGFSGGAVACAACAAVVSEWHIDHRTPIFKGGRHDAENIQLLCHDCHKAKTREERDTFNDQPDLFAAAGSARPEVSRNNNQEDETWT